MMAGSSSITIRHQQLDSILEELLDQLQQADVGSVCRTWVFFQPELRKVVEELYKNMEDQVKELQRQWGSLRTSIDEVKKWSNADKVVDNYRSLTIKVEAKAEEIAKKLSIACRKRYITKQPSSVMDELQVCASEISDLNPEIAQAFESILSSFLSVKLHSPLHDLSLWIKFATSTLGNLNVIDLYPDGDLTLLTSFISFLYRIFPRGFMITGDGGQNQEIIEGFFAHAASVVFRVACVCYSVWFGARFKRGRIFYIVREISLANPEYLEFSLKFLKALNQLCRGPTTVAQSTCVKIFFNRALWGQDSLLESFICRDLVDLIINVFIIPELESSIFNDLVDLIINVFIIPELESAIFNDLVDLIISVFVAPEQPSDQDEECSIAETKQVIMELIPVFFSSYGWNFLLRVEIWLCKADLFLKEQLLSETIFSDPAKDQIACLVNGLKDIAYYKLEENEYTILTEKVASKITSLYQSLCAGDMKEYMVRSSVSLLLSEIVLFRAIPKLMELLNRNGSVIANNRDQLQDLLEGLHFFKSFITDKQVEKIVHKGKIFTPIEAVGRRKTLLYYSVGSKAITEETIKKKVTVLLDKVKIIKSESGHFFPQIPRNNFPKKSAGMGFLDSLLGNLLELLKRDPPSIALVKKYIKKIQLDLELLRPLLTENLQDTELLVSKDLAIRVTKMTYELDYVIDSVEVGIGLHGQHVLWLFALQKDIRFINLLAKAKLQVKTSGASVHEIPQISSHISRAGTLETDKLVVCLSDQEEIIIDRLTRGSSQRDMVSIVGMPGLGKSTLAKKVFDHPKVAYHFHRRAWCFVSQSYEKRDLLLNLLRDIQGLTDEIHEMVVADLELKLYQCLRRNRYLIVMDDMWDVGAWNDLERSFPDDGNGSRILITSRLHKVALDAMPASDPHPLRVLSQEESWKLLQMRIFHKGGCFPEELVEVGKEIAEHCKGLPLAVVAIAGILEKTEQKYHCWKRISEELNTQVIDDPQTRCKDILELSYNHLPTHLKACFLYFGAFQEDRDVRVRKLIRLWIAEGFIQKTKAKSLEEIGEDYLIDLIDRSLVMISERRSLGGVKECRIHDLLRDLCRSTSKQENFLQLITRYDEPYASFHYVDDDVDFDNDDPFKIAEYESHRVSICLKRKHFVDSRPSGPCTRSLMFYVSNDANPRRPYNISFISQSFKLLRVLDLECINMGNSFPAEMELLVQLRYLALSGDLDSIPESIAKLWKLETLILKGLSGKVVLPHTFWCMTSLRHVHVKNQAAFNLQSDKFGIVFKLDNLVTFSSPSFPCGKDTEKILRKLSNLRKLRFIFLESLDSSRNLNPFPRLDFLNQLESLNILYSGRARNPGDFNLPLNLRKLTLSKFRLSWNHISAIGRLPNLEVLKLLSGAMEGLIWNMSEEEFRQLKFLKLDSLNIIQWNASSDHLPNLQQLVLWNCKDLEQVPYEFSEISTLQIIQVQRCSISTEESIRNIEESTEGIQVLINR